ncbi:MAG: gliding motility lipoprotein GldH [Muribaculaceae bacterium]|nr:gliding motility lipoprotein GldH [Muribaculaceae bacterium]
MNTASEKKSSKLKSYWPLLAVMGVLALSSCSLRHNDYSEYCTFDNNAWAYDSVLTFTPELKDDSARGSLEIALRHTNAYPYSNIFLEISYPVECSPDSVCVKYDTIEVELSDVYGKWYGKGSRLSYQLRKPLASGVTLYNKKPVQVRHLMRADTLREIEQVGLFFTEYGRP